MPLSAWPWVIGAGAALLGSGFALRQKKTEAGLLPKAEFLWLTLAVLAAVIGLGWRAWEARAWPGTSPADALALLAGGGLVVVAWQMLTTGMPNQPSRRRPALSLTLFASAALLGTAAALTLAWTASPLTLPAGAWIFGLRNILAGIGLGGWLPALAASVLWLEQALIRPAPIGPAESRSDSTSMDASTLPPARSETINPAEDPGRIAALFSFPWLTGACLASGAWNLVAHAAIGRAMAANLWLLAAWLLGGAYLHITSSWRPLRLPGWLSPLLAAGTLAAGVLAAATAGSLR